MTTYAGFVCLGTCVLLTVFALGCAPGEQTDAVAGSEDLTAHVSGNNINGTWAIGPGNTKDQLCAARCESREGPVNCEFKLTKQTQRANCNSIPSLKNMLLTKVPDSQKKTLFQSIPTPELDTSRLPKKYDYGYWYTACVEAIFNIFTSTGDAILLEPSRSTWSRQKALPDQAGEPARVRIPWGLPGQGPQLGSHSTEVRQGASFKDCPTRFVAFKVLGVLVGRSAEAPGTR